MKEAIEDIAKLTDEEIDFLVKGDLSLRKLHQFIGYPFKSRYQFDRDRKFPTNEHIGLALRNLCCDAKFKLH